MSKISPGLWFDGDPRLLGDPDAVTTGRVMLAMLSMTKVNVAGLRAAHDSVEEEDRRGAAK